MVKKSKNVDFNKICKFVTAIGFLGKVMHFEKFFRGVGIKKSGITVSELSPQRRLAFIEMEDKEDAIIGGLMIAKAIASEYKEDVDILTILDKDIIIRMVNDILDVSYLAKRNMNSNKLYEGVLNISERTAQWLKDRNIGFEMFIAMDSFSGEVSSSNVFEQEDFNSNVLSAVGELITTYTVMILPKIMRFKNNKLRGCKMENDVRKMELNFTKTELFDKNFLIYLSNKNFENVEERDFKKLEDFSTAFYNELDRVRNSYLKNVTGLNFGEKGHKYYVLNKKLGDYPFMTKGKFDIDLNRFNQLNQHRKYATSKTVIVDILDKTKHVDNIEIEDFDEKHLIISVNFINHKEAFGFMSLNYAEQKTNDIVPKTEGYITDKYITFTYRLDKSLLDSNVGENIVENLINVDKERNVTDLRNKLFGCNRSFSYMDSETFKNSLLHIEKMNYLVLSCVFIVYCDINYKGIKVYSQREIVGNGTKSRKTKEAIRVAHIRRLPKGYNVSDFAKENARKMHVILPRGYTFVQEHLSKDEKKIIKVKG